VGEGGFINQMSGYQLFNKDICMVFVLFARARTSFAPFSHLVKFCKFMSRSVCKLTSHISSLRCHLAVNATGQNPCTKLMSQSVLFSCLKSFVMRIKQVGAKLTLSTCAERERVRIQACYRLL
jgi:hypothetical protein